MAKRDTNGDDPIVIALDSFSIGETVIIQGNSYRTSHPVVRERPEAFIDWYSTTDERARAHRELMATERERVGLP